MSSGPNNRNSQRSSQEPSAPDSANQLEWLIKEDEAARLLGHSIRTLQNWRVRGGGPRFVKFSARSVRYRRTDLSRWIQEHLVSHTSEVA